MDAKGITGHWATGLGSQLHELGERKGFKEYLLCFLICEMYLTHGVLRNT